VSVTVVVLTEELPFVCVAVVNAEEGALGVCSLGVETPLEGPEPGAC
jgi:hypothetical protein